jgi:hypothetical protein
MTPTKPIPIYPYTHIPTNNNSNSAEAYVMVGNASRYTTASTGGWLQWYYKVCIKPITYMLHMCIKPTPSI